MPLWGLRNFRLLALTRIRKKQEGWHWLHLFLYSGASACHMDPDIKRSSSWQNVINLKGKWQLGHWFDGNSQIRSNQSLSCVQLFAIPWITARQAFLSITNSRSSLRLTSIESVMPSSHLILCRPLLLLPPISPSIRVFSNESTLHTRWPKYWSFSFSVSPSKDPRTDLLQNRLVGSPCSPRDSQESSPTPQFKGVDSSALSLLHSPTLTSIHDHRKTKALTRGTFVGKVMSLLLNMLSRLVITFLSRSKRLLISWLQSPSVVILEPRKIKSDTVSTVSPSISQEVMGPDAIIQTSIKRIRISHLPGAGEKHSTCDKGHEEGGSAYSKAGLSLGSLPRYSRASSPQKTESAYFIALCSHLWLYWGLSPTTISLSLSKS